MGVAFDVVKRFEVGLHVVQVYSQPCLVCSGEEWSTVMVTMVAAGRCNVVWSSVFNWDVTQ